ncbi:MAG: ATP synthase F0 subunit B [Endomicrobium sp.]|nr:ATP synthase F0 subunit B [Endomicrobium sp.]
MEILHTLGLEWKLFLGQIINFLIIAYILKRFLYKPIRKMLEERRLKIDQSLADAENAKAALENAGLERKKILEGAKNDAGALAAAAKISLEENKQKMTEEAKKQSEQIITDAKQKASAEFDGLSKRIGQISVDLSGKILSKVFADLFTEDEKQKVIAKALDKIEKGGYEKIAN